MDTHKIPLENLSDDRISLEQFRLRSARRREREARKDFDKKLIRLFREQRAISQQLWNLGYEELNPPVTRGWKRSFVLREDVAISKDAKFFQGILDKINTVEYSWKKDFKLKRRLRGKKIYVERPLKLKQPGPFCFMRNKLTDVELKHFDLVMSTNRIGNQFIWVHQFREPWRFVVKVEPNIIRHTKIKDYDLERRRDEIDRYLGRDMYRKVNKLMHGNVKYRWRYNGDLPKYKYHSFRNRSFAEILFEHWPQQNLNVLKEKPSESEGFFICV